ncbi:PTPRK-like protein [Mya arenaria]|uniref:protein-tyrosine-phosphatase n=1 Tax=Mya arenaria TaxID=6604 RepID=A0ABY7F795_MYAAR|nr:PTPRK-like protein [Mya arenaria]
MAFTAMLCLVAQITRDIIFYAILHDTIEDDAVGPPLEAIAGGVGGGVVAIGIVVALSIFFRRSTRKPVSSQTMQNGNTTFQADIVRNPSHRRKSTCYPATSKRTHCNKQVFTHEETAFENENGLEIDDESNGGLILLPLMIIRITKNLEHPVTSQKYPLMNLNHEAFVAEFEKFSRDLVKPYVESQKKENLSKNRYKGGYKKPQQYIATLGPMSKQLENFNLFWKMIWQQRVEKIVMVTNLVENGSPKCEQYWPNQGATKTYGDKKVESRSEDEYAEFTRRVFTVAMGTEERTLHHLHFTCWPDKSIPDDITAIIEFRQRVLTTPSTLNGPTVVHCRFV